MAFTSWRLEANPGELISEKRPVRRELGCQNPAPPHSTNAKTQR